MPEYLAPGVFVEEIDSGSKPIEGVGVNTAAFVGYAKSGDFNTPTFISNYTQFTQYFGEEENALTIALCKELKMTVAEVRAEKAASRKSWNEYAADAVKQAIKSKKATVKSYGHFLTTYEVPQDGLPFIEGTYLAHAVKGYYDNGGGRAYIVRIARPADIETLQFQAATPAITEAKSAQVTAGPLLIKAAKTLTGAAGNDIQVTVDHIGDGNEFKLKISHGAEKETWGDTKDKDGKEKGLTLETLSSVRSKLVELSVEKTAVTTATRPEATLFTLRGGLDASVPATVASGASMVPMTPDEAAVIAGTADDFIGAENLRTGMSGLLAIEGVNFISAPDLMAGLYTREQATPVKADAGPAMTDEEKLQAMMDGTWKPEEKPVAPEVGPEKLKLDAQKAKSILTSQCALVALCERMGERSAILDSLPGLKPQQMNDITMNTAYNCDHGHAAIYYPWLKVADPLHQGQTLYVPPSGHMAGVWARAASERGVHKAPANEAVIGAVDLEYYVTKGEQDLLNPNGINCIRSFPGRGIRVWGARTLATVGNPSWKYINVRRLFDYIESSMDRNLQWVVFEPNDEDLWGRVRRTISAFLFTCWKEGMLFGSTPDQAYYVKCDTETNPQEMIDLGRLYCEIGVNPVKPAEFVIIRIGQWASSSSIAEQ